MDHGLVAGETIWFRTQLNNIEVLAKGYFIADEGSRIVVAAPKALNVASAEEFEISDQVEQSERESWIIVGLEHSHVVDSAIVETWPGNKIVAKGTPSPKSLVRCYRTASDEFQDVPSSSDPGQARPSVRMPKGLHGVANAVLARLEALERRLDAPTTQAKAPPPPPPEMDRLLPNLSSSSGLWGPAPGLGPFLGMGGLTGQDEDQEGDDEDEDPFEFLMGPRPKAQPPHPKASIPSASVAAPGIDPNLLIQMEIVKALKRMQAREESDGDEDLGDVWGSSAGAASGKPKAFEGVHQMRRAFQKNPKRLTKDYLIWSCELLGVVGNQQWALRDVPKKVPPQFGKMKGLWRAYHMMHEALQLSLHGSPEHTQAYLVQASKAIYQTALDQGDWANAVLLVPTPDPLARPDFGGTPQELQKVHQYRKALAELRRPKHLGAAPDEKEEEDALPKQGAPKKK